VIIDILSDLHVDFYFKFKKPEPKAVESLYSHIILDNQKRDVGDVLIVAGDIGHYNSQNINVLKLIKEIFGYKHIICVLGNHDYYLIDRPSKSKYFLKSVYRAERMREIINSSEGMYCLDGEVVEIDGIKFGGCDGWYDGEYTKRYFGNKTDEYLDKLWGATMNDAYNIYSFNWQEYAKLEKQKIEKIYKNVDVMITHINPSIQKEHTSVSFREEDTTGFFTFDGSKYLEGGSMKYWVFGHTHTEISYECSGVKCICNPMGYPGENDYGEWTWIRSVEL
jgi:metallophosphoesterase superfamily enzyme